MSNATENAYKTVLNDLIKCNMFIGHFDASNGNRQFMRGICTVMEFIAIQAGFENFTELFYHNMEESEDMTKGETID